MVADPPHALLCYAMHMLFHALLNMQLYENARLVKTYQKNRKLYRSMQIYAKKNKKVHRSPYHYKKVHKYNLNYIKVP